MKKLHRLAGEKKIAGVCAGLGEYFDVDPVFFRLFFLVSLFFGGLGALIYLLLWIMAPEKAGDAPPRPAASLQLSRSDRKIAGVCGGLGKWLDVDPVFLRVAFVLLALLGGLGIVVYIVLWLFVPREPVPGG
jgi:phage shock protein PspC (stress-responsive transcriptional regulator)